MASHSLRKALRSRLLLAAEPTKAVVVTSTKQQATELVAVLRAVRDRFDLRQLRAELLVGKGMQEKRSQGATGPLGSNVIVATPGMLENVLHRGEWNLTQFRLMVVTSRMRDISTESVSSRSGTTARRRRGIP